MPDVRFEMQLDAATRDDLAMLAWLNRESASALARRFIEQGLASFRSAVGDAAVDEARRAWKRRIEP
jgi:hypothetical protein